MKKCPVLTDVKHRTGVGEWEMACGDPVPWLGQSVGAAGSHLVSTAGRQFLFLDRESSFETLAVCIKKRYANREEMDRTCHPIPFLADGPGTGKSRFLVELPGAFRQFVSEEARGFSDVNTLLQNAFFVNITFGNGSKYSGEEEAAISISLSVAIRIMFVLCNQKLDFASFRAKYSTSTEKIVQSRILSAVMRFIRETTECSALVLGIDEVNAVDDISHEKLKELFFDVGTLSCSAPVFFVPVLAGTVVGSMLDFVALSTHLPRHIPLPLLSYDACLKIIDRRNPQLKQALSADKRLEIAIADVGGHCRTLELLYNALSANKAVLG